MKSKNIYRWAWLIGSFAFLMLWNVTNTLLHFGLSSAAAVVPSRRTVLTVSKMEFQLPSSSNLPLCRREQIRDGSWQSFQRKPYYISRNRHLRCDNVTSIQQEIATWEWIPHDTTCRLTLWNAAEFCALTRFATISIMGDSLSWEHYSSLLQLLGQRVHQTNQHQSRLEQVNHIQAACVSGNNSATKFVFRNLPLLSADAVQDSIRHDFPHVLILNTGAHYQNDTELLSSIRETIVVLQEWKGTCRAVRIKCHLFWRTTVPGHPNCHSFSAPVNNRSAMEWLVENPAFYDKNYNDPSNNNNKKRYSYEGTSPNWNFHWYDFRRQNQLVLAELESHPTLEVQIIDGYDLNILRPDGHRRNDCLHNCYPGKMDLYNQLLLHYLQQSRTKADTDKLLQRFEQVNQKRQAKQPKES